MKLIVIALSLLIPGFSFAQVGPLKGVDLSCIWTHPKNPKKTMTLLWSFIESASTITIQKPGKIRTQSFSHAEIRFNLLSPTGWDYEYIFDRTRMKLSERNATAVGNPPAFYDCVVVDPKV